MISDTVTVQIAQFGTHMIAALRAAGPEKGNWEDYKPQTHELCLELQYQLDALKVAICKRDYAEVTSHATHLANFAMKAHELFGVS